MSKYRNRLPQLQSALFLTDGGLETTLIFHEGCELPYFAAFDLLKNHAGTATLNRYFACYPQGPRGLDESTALDIGNPAELGTEYRALRTALPKLAVVGGGCGTDHRHVAAICDHLHQVAQRTRRPMSAHRIAARA